MADLYRGRLFSDGNLYADQRERVGEKTVVVRGRLGRAERDEHGEKVTVVIPQFKFGPDHGREVKHVPGEGYVFVDRNRGDTGHQEDHHRQFVMIDHDPTDPHAFAAQPGDAHYDAESPGCTKLKADPDTIARVITGHTDAYEMPK